MNNNSNKAINIAMASDSNYLEFVATCLVSFMENNRSFDEVNLYLLTNNIESSEIKKLYKSISAYGNLHTILIDISNLSDLIESEVPSTIAITSYARLFLPSLLPHNINKILYLDCDIIVNDDLGDLYSSAFVESVGGVLDILPNSLPKTNVGKDSESPYVNAGVLIINLDFWRSNNFQRRFIDFIKYKNGNVHHHDQGVINAVCDGNIKILHPRYNVHSSYFSHPYELMQKSNKPFYSRTEVKEAITTPAIIHYTIGYYNRPWIKNSKHPMKHLFMKYHNMTAWRDSMIRKDERSYLVRFISWEFLSLPLPIYFGSVKAISYIKKIKKFFYR